VVILSIAVGNGERRVQAGQGSLGWS